MRKGKLIIFIAMLLVLALATTASANIADKAKSLLGGKSPQAVRVYVDGNLVYFPDQKPYIDKNNRTLVPVRFVSESLGATVDWNGAKQEVLVNHEANEKLVHLWVGKRDYTINGKAAQMDTQAVLTDKARVMVPLRFVSEALGAEVKWEVVLGNDIVHTFTLGQTDEEIAEIMKKVREEIEAESKGYNTGRDTKGWPEIDPNSTDYGLGKGYYNNHYMDVTFYFEDPSFDPAKARNELFRLITACGYSSAQADEVLDYAFSKTDREVSLQKNFFVTGSNEIGWKMITVSSAVGANLVAVTIDR